MRIYEQTFHRRERRYPITDDRTLAKLLKLGVKERYNVLTLYLAIDGKLREPGGPKRRIRTYDEGPISWLEEKRRKGNIVDKVRVPILWSSIASLAPWTPLMAVGYERSVLKIKDLRVTLDQHLVVCDRDLNGLVVIPEAVVETKGDAKLPAELRRLIGKPDESWSKSKRALAIIQRQVSWQVQPCERAHDRVA